MAAKVLQTSKDAEFSLCKSFLQEQTTRNCYTVQIYSCRHFFKPKLHLAPLTVGLQVRCMALGLNKETICCSWHI